MPRNASERDWRVLEEKMWRPAHWSVENRTYLVERPNEAVRFWLVYLGDESTWAIYQRGYQTLHDAREALRQMRDNAFFRDIPGKGIALRRDRLPPYITF